MTKQNNSKCPDCQKASGEKYSLTSVRFVGIEFDPKKINAQENELNDALRANYSVMEHIQTATGLVFILGKFGKTNSEEQNELRDRQSVFDPAEAVRRTSRISPEEEEALRNTVNDDRRFN